jgi:hypothetical protein
MAHAVRRDVHASPDLAECWGLLVDSDPQTVRNQRMGCEQTADPSSHDYNVEARLRHRHILGSNPP